MNLTVQPGEILALVGENGAGKSTLMKILSGVYPVGEFEGQIEVQNQSVRFRNPRDSESYGISLIHQELSTFPQLSVAENMMVGHWPTRNGFVDHAKMEKNAKHWLNLLDSDFSVDQKMSTLSPGQQQVVEIGKALSRNSKILILDEPTSSLTHRETKKLFLLLQDLRKQGCGIIYISHRMEEIFHLADKVIVLRDGRSVFTSAMAGLTSQDLIRAMVGRELEQASQSQVTSARQNSVLDVFDFCARHITTKKNYGPLTFSLAEGEILGFGGLLGAGRSEILQALCGDEAFVTTGDVKFKKTKTAFSQLQDSYRQGFGFVPEDRKVQSILPTRSLVENTGLLRLVQRHLFSWVSKTREKEKTKDDLKILNTRFFSTEQTISELSGGNQQKVIFARVMQNSPQILILDEPTRGVDVGAKSEIYKLIRQWAQQGKAIILVSSDLPELMALSDRITVMSNGCIQGQLLKSEFHEEAIIKLAIQTHDTQKVT